MGRDVAWMRYARQTPVGAGCRHTSWRSASRRFWRRSVWGWWATCPGPLRPACSRCPATGARRNLRSALRKLEASAHRIVYGRELAATSIEAYLGALSQMNIARFRQKGQRSAWLSTGFRECLTQAARYMAEEGRLRIDTLRIDGGLAAIVIGFVLNGCYHGFQSAFDSHLAEHSPNHCLWAKCMESCIAEGLVGFDFGAGEHEYKTGYFSGRRPTGYMLISKTQPRSLWDLGTELSCRGLRGVARGLLHGR